jgi:hypothetical protein
MSELADIVVLLVRAASVGDAAGVGHEAHCRRALRTACEARPVVV